MIYILRNKGSATFGRYPKSFAIYEIDPTVIKKLPFKWEISNNRKGITKAWEGKTFTGYGQWDTQRAIALTEAAKYTAIDFTTDSLTVRYIKEDACDNGADERQRTAVKLVNCLLGSRKTLRIRG